MEPDYERAKEYVLSRLANELSPWLTYHSLQHTRDDVLPAAERLGHHAGLEPAALLLLTTAALYHDTGFLVSYEDHETHSIFLARETLPTFGYTLEQIAVIAELIAATCMPQQPVGLLAELLCDADLDVLGRDDFWPLNRRLLAEARHFTNPGIDEAEWLRGQAEFLTEHRYFSPAARTLRDQGKARNLLLMRRALANMDGSSAIGDRANDEYRLTGLS